MSQCALPCCNKPAASKCSVCLMEPYCCGECQKADWKRHKLICKVLKRLSTELQPYHQVVQVSMEILDLPGNLRILSHLLHYAETQFGERIVGETYRQRGNGEKIDNLTVEIRIVISIYRGFISVYGEDRSLSEEECRKIKIPYYLKMIEVLKPWALFLDTESRGDTLSVAQIDYLWELLSHTELELAMIFMGNTSYDIAEMFFKKALAYARRYGKEGDKKTTLMHVVLSTFCQLRNLQLDFESAVILAEEAYDNVAVAYNPVHPKV
jgi:hypothetical protein